MNCGRMGQGGIVFRFAASRLSQRCRGHHRAALDKLLAKRTFDFRELIDSDLIAQLFGCGRRLFIKRRAGRVRNAIDCVEKPGDARRIDERSLAHRVHDRSPRPGETLIIASENGLGKFDQQRAIRNTGIARKGAPGHGMEVKCVVGMLAARTEQLRMPRGSIGTLIQRRHARRHQLDLGMRDGSIFLAEVPHLRPGKVLGGR